MPCCAVTLHLQDGKRSDESMGLGSRGLGSRGLGSRGLGSGVKALGV